MLIGAVAASQAFALLLHHVNHNSTAQSAHCSASVLHCH